MATKVSLPPALETFVRRQVSSGRYASASDVISAALRLLEAREAQLQALVADAAKGPAQLDAGAAEHLDVASIKERGRQQLARRRSLRGSVRVVGDIIGPVGGGWRRGRGR